MANQNDPRVLRTRRLIQDAFLELIQKRDFEDITIADIAEKATINRATFYAHFQDKYALLEAVVANRIQVHLSHWLDGKKGLERENLNAIIFAVCDYHDSLSGRCRTVHQAFAPLVEAQIRKAIHTLTGEGSAEGKIGVLADMLSCAIYGAVNRHYLTVGLADREALASEILPFILAGIEAMRG
jgi:AcrR family transcriptional regulator